MASTTNEKSGPLKPSFVILRHMSGKYEVRAVAESADPALNFHAAIKRARGEVMSAGKSIHYSHAWLFLRGRAHKPLVFI